MEKRVWRSPCLIIFLFVALAGCSTSGGDAKEDPLPTQNISGVWLGYLVSGALYPNGIFTVGIVTEDREARFIGNNTQFVGPEGSLAVTPNSNGFSGNMVHWTTTGLSPVYNSFEKRPINIIIGFVSTKQLIYSAFYQYSNSSDSGSMSFLPYNNTYDTSPDVSELSGTWEIKDSPHAGESVTLDIVPNIDDTTTASLTGNDTLGNTFTGEISVHHGTREGTTRFNVYDVQLAIDGGATLHGLATYVTQANEDDPDDIKNQIATKTLAIGVTNDDETCSLSGLGTLVPAP